MTTTLKDIQAREAQHVLQTYRRLPVLFVRGKGSYLYDADDRACLDLVSGIGVASLGHGHQGLADVICNQASTLLHTSNLFYHPLQAEVADRLAALSGLDRVFFCNSGTEAVEACLKLSRRYWYTQGATHRTGFVALEGSFSGRTMGALSVTHDPNYRNPFAPLVGPVTFVNPDAPESLALAITNETAAVIVEPIQGEGGVRPLSADFAHALQDACRRTGTLLIADEVQTGMGRTGVAFGYQWRGLHPDLASVGKAIGAGVPMGAALVSQRIADAVSPGDHGSTYGGNLLACRAAAFFLEQLMDHGLQEQIRATGEHLERELRALALRHPVIVEVRGAGLMWGIELTSDATPVVTAALERGVLVNRTDQTVIRLLPPLTILPSELDQAILVLDAVLEQLALDVSA